MEKAFYKKHNSKFFQGMRAIVIKRIVTKGGDAIEVDECVTILGKMSGGWQGGFCIKSDNGFEVTGVTPDYLDLISEDYKN